MRKIVIAGSLCLALGTTATGCFGKFALTRKLYEFNQGLSDNKFIRSLATWVMVIIPVYGIGGVIDFLVLNTIEFWTGDNLLGANESAADAGRLVITEQPDGSATFTRGDATYRLVPNGANGFTLERDGVRIGTAEVTEDGGLLAYDANGDVVRALSASEVEARAAEIRMHAGL